jgi:acyl-CoA thioester hydrolase
MSRVKLIFPDVALFSCNIPILIQHINYGNHVGNDSVISILHHARVQFLQSIGYSELYIEGAGVIMADLQVQYKQQLFLHNKIIVAIAVSDITNNSFAINYKILIQNEQNTTAVLAKTNMVCFDYATQKICAVPNAFIQKINTTINH